ncbi:MAG: aminopeptidase P family protein, partial [Candidatus Latescibacteria bacterium]|nr:aminopeptidase P family protein [Candidatus Latescibacterota bacterium]
TLATGEASPVLSDRFAALRTCLDAAISIMRPGVKASAVQAPMQATLKAYGLTGSFPHGHGVGLEVRDYPIIVPDNGLRIRDDCIDVPSDLTLEADMVINLEAPLFMPGVGSLHIEQSFVITSNGCRPLVSQDRGRIVTSDE